MVPTAADAAPAQREVVESTSAEEPTNDAPLQRSAHNSGGGDGVLDLTDAAIATAETTQTGHGNDAVGEHGMNTASAVPSISLPRQSRDVKHFALGKSPREPNSVRVRLQSPCVVVYHVNSVNAILPFSCPKQRLSFPRHGRISGEDRLLFP
jgi:hypothetical protein